MPVSALGTADHRSDGFLPHGALCLVDQRDETHSDIPKVEPGWKRGGRD